MAKYLFAVISGFIWTHVLSDKDKQEYAGCVIFGEEANSRHYAILTKYLRPEYVITA